jgi:hypothetical protein
MADDGTETVAVEVEVPATDPPEVTTPDVTVVNAGGTDDTATLVSLAEQVGALTAIVAGLQAQNAETEETAERAEDIAEYAADSASRAESAAIEAEITTVELVEDNSTETETEAETEDAPPARPHWVHRSMRDLFGGDK